MSDEAVTTPGNGFNVAGFVGRIREHIAQLLHGAVQAGIEIDEGVRGPEPLMEFFAGNDIAGMLQQQRQYLEGLILKFQADAVLAQLT